MQDIITQKTSVRKLLTIHDIFWYLTALLWHTFNTADTFVAAMMRRTVTGCLSNTETLRSNACGTIEPIKVNILLVLFTHCQHMCIHNTHTIAIRASDDWFSCSRINRTIEEAICVSQCVAQRIGIVSLCVWWLQLSVPLRVAHPSSLYLIHALRTLQVDADGNLVPDAVRNYTQQLSQAGWQRAAAANVSDTCLAEDANATATPTTDNGCNMAALRLSYCLWREFTRACPRELQSRSKRCLLLRDRLVNGENLELQAYQSFRLHPLADHKAQSQPEQQQRPEVTNVASRMLMGLA